MDHDGRSMTEFDEYHEQRGAAAGYPMSLVTIEGPALTERGVAPVVTIVLVGGAAALWSFDTLHLPRAHAV